MSTVTEIESAALRLSRSDLERLVARLAGVLADPAGATPPKPRHFSREQIDAWIAEDERDMREFRAGGTRE